MHVVPGLKVLYFGTPVVLVGTRNEDGTANLAPISSAWWLGQYAMLGLGDVARTTANLLREGECVLSLPSPALADAVDRLALTTGSPDVPEKKAKQGYRYEPEKFAVAHLTEQPSDLVRPSPSARSSWSAGSSPPTPSAAQGCTPPPSRSRSCVPMWRRAWSSRARTTWTRTAGTR
ncbi:hypothetical protein ABT216_10420 [Streptomyces albidoflavus]